MCGKRKLEVSLSYKIGNVRLDILDNIFEVRLKIAVGLIKKEKLELNLIIDKLDKKGELLRLSDEDLSLKNFANERLAHLLREEEIKWYQRSKAKFLLEGDRNTRYYLLITNGKHRRQRIFQLGQEEWIIRGDVQLKKNITNYYKDLFGPAEVNHLSMIESFRGNIPQILDVENKFLIEPVGVLEPI